MSGLEWAIYSTDEEAWWSNEDGWVGLDEATTFTSEEAREHVLLDGPPLILWVRLDGAD